MNNERLEVRNLQKIYGKKTVVQDVSLDISQGEIVGLLGPNGAGKTTTFYMIVGVIKPNGGELKLGETAMNEMPMYKRARLGITYLPQESSVFKKMTVEENIRAVLELKNFGTKEIDERTEKVLAELSITHIRKNKGYYLSGGERRRTEIARALCLEPKFLLLDEPFAGIDPIAVTDIQNIIRQLKRRNIGVLITDHNVRETLSITDKSYIIYQGKILFSGTSEELIKNEEARKIYLGENFKI
jgi:lipopolysaccharide export system ATP-binding protein